MEALADVPLEGVRLVVNDVRRKENVLTEEHVIEAAGWKLHVHVQGKKDAPAIVTYHDIGMNYASAFDSFFSSDEMSIIRDKFSIYHVTAPGQADNATTLPDEPAYPNMEQLSDQMLILCDHFKINRFIGWGGGAGANILLRFAMSHPDMVEGLVVINATVRRAGWVEWFYLKWAIRYLWQGVMNLQTEDYFVWHHLGYKTSYENEDLANTYRRNLSVLNPANLAKFTQAFLWRDEIVIKRVGGDPNMGDAGDKVRSTLTCPVLNVVGDWSPHIEESVDLNTKLRPQDACWFKLSDSGGMVQEENPVKLAEAFILMLKGNGYAALERTNYNRPK
jgi:pimeloyl-ACP methyl ester carboxylesterase